MDFNTRACVAYIVGNFSNKSITSVYDYSKSSYLNISGTVTNETANIYDYERNCNLSGSLSRIYDYGNNAFIQLTISGNQFTGHDFNSGCNYNGSISGNSISIYDYETSQYHDYRV